MSQTLDEFLQEIREELVRFEKMWRDEHKNFPNEFPLEFSDGNEGLWWEFLSTEVYNNDGEWYEE